VRGLVSNRHGHGFMIAAAPTPATPPSRAFRDDANLIDQLLAEQGRLATPVARFANQSGGGTLSGTARFRELIPLTKPGPGEQYAFEVSLDRCTGCKACVSACHSLNGLDEHEVWRDTGVLVGGTDLPGWQQTITSACHHCEDPACLNGCPVGAYEKDADTGIVRHLDDQCIGCSYCILKCPYDVPKYSKKRGIVRKCDMCHQRLAEGEAPACVQACPTEAIRIVKVAAGRPFAEDSNLFGERVRKESALPSSRITRPATRYVGRPVPGSAMAADRDALVAEHAHWPLILMLVMTQSGIGLLIGGGGFVALTGTFLFFVGMAASVLHLGQPLKAWRFFIGLRTSWLSREILAFSLLAPLPILMSALELVSIFPQIPHPGLASEWIQGLRHAAFLLMVPVSLAAVFTSVMIYQDTARAGWRFTLTAFRFFGTVAAFALLGMLLVNPTPPLILAFATVVLIKMIPESRMLRLLELDNPSWSADLHMARVQMGPLRRVLNTRFLLAFAAIAIAFVSAGLALPFLLAAELIERRLFFQAVHAPKMPGNFGPR
jgi:formate dehydrogenase iron-sulfur subunit